MLDIFITYAMLFFVKFFTNEEPKKFKMSLEIAPNMKDAT